MCDSMQAVAEDMYWLNSSSCNKTNDECTSELLCTMEDSALQQVTMSISQCDNPPTLTLGMVANGQSYTTELTDNTTRALGDFGVTVIYTVWYYDYSMDIQVCMYIILCIIHTRMYMKRRKKGARTVCLLVFACVGYWRKKRKIVLDCGRRVPTSPRVAA